MEGRGPQSQVEAEAELLARQRVCELCRHLYSLGWASGTGGGFSLRQGERLYVAPSGVPKERIAPEEVFVLDLDGKVLKSGQASQSGVGGLVAGGHGIFQVQRRDAA